MLKLTGNSIKQIIKNVFKQINAPYHVIISDTEANEEKASLHLTKKSVYILLSSILVALFLLFSALLLLTPLRYYLPGSSNSISRKELIHLRKLSDSLIIINQQREAFLYNIIKVTQGNHPIISDTNSLTTAEIEKFKDINEDKISKASDFNALRFQKLDTTAKTQVNKKDTSVNNLPKK